MFSEIWSSSSYIDKLGSVRIFSTVGTTLLVFPIEAEYKLLSSVLQTTLSYGITNTVLIEK